jgi:hypothetical protein
MIVFDPNMLYRPVCFRNTGPMTLPWFSEGGLIALDGRQTEEYRASLRDSMRSGYRVSEDGHVYVSAWDLWHEDMESRWNFTIHLVDRILMRRGMNSRPPDESPFPESHSECDFIRKIAIES